MPAEHIAPVDQNLYTDDDLPDLAASAVYIAGLAKPTAAEVLQRADESGDVAIQPRCGVGSHEAMRELLTTLAQTAAPDIATITIDSHTRLQRWSNAAHALANYPSQLNGYPLVTHGWLRGRELNESVASPIEIRHGSPDGPRLFRHSIAAGFTSYEGGGISYNLPYSKDVPIADSLNAWFEVDTQVGELRRNGIEIDREFFGTLTAVMMPPSISLAVVLLEAMLAAAAGARCLSLAYPQTGNIIQDVAAMQAARSLAVEILPSDARVHIVLHEFMGAFPATRRNAESLILHGAFAAKLGRASKLITKTYQEALGIPDTAANAAGMNLARAAISGIFDAYIDIDRSHVEEEAMYIAAEVHELIDPLLNLSWPQMRDEIVRRFAAGLLDIPFSASRYARSSIIPARAADGSIRFLNPGALPFSRQVLERNNRALGRHGKLSVEELQRDVFYFPRYFGEIA